MTNHPKSSTVIQMDSGSSTDPGPLLTTDAILRNNPLLAFNLFCLLMVKLYDYLSGSTKATSRT